MLTKEEQDDLDRHIAQYNSLTERGSISLPETGSVGTNANKPYHKPNTLQEIQDYFKSPAVQVHRGNGYVGTAVLRTLSAKDRMYRKKLLLV